MKQLRPNQQAMMSLIADYRHSSKSEGLCIEAPTGTGKTYAYCVEALKEVADGGFVLIALHSNGLFNQCLRELSEAMEQTGYEAAVGALQGKLNYPCQQEEQRTKEDSKSLNTNEKGKIFIDDPEMHVSHDPEECYYAARAYARKCDIVVTNHHLALFDDMLDQRILREVECSSKVDDMLLDDDEDGDSVALDDVKRVLCPFTLRIFDEGHELHQALHTVYDLEIDFSIEGGIHPLLKRHLHAFVTSFPVGEAFSQPNPDGVTMMQRCLHILRRARKSNVHLSARIKSLDAMEKKLHAQEEKLLKGKDVEGQRERLRLKEVINKSRLSSHDEMFGKQFDNCFYYRDSENGKFYKKAIETGRYFTSAQTICTSATFSSLLTQEDLRIRNVQRLPETFDMAKQRRFFFGEQQNLLEAVHFSKGDALVLCTSWDRAETIAYQLRRDGFKVFLQDRNKQHDPIEDFRDSQYTVLVGVDSYWTGLDLKGNTLRHVIIDHLPFKKPDTYANLKDAYYKEKGLGAFLYYKERMLIRLRQGIGRLIRDSSDKGVVSILDKRWQHCQPYHKIAGTSLCYDALEDCLEYVS